MHHRESIHSWLRAALLLFAGCALSAGACAPGLNIPAGSYSKRWLHTHMPGQVQVLHVGATGESAGAPEVALDKPSFAALWHKHAVAYPRPELDMTRWVVVARTAERTAGAPPEITRVRMSRKGVVRILGSKRLAPAAPMTFGKYVEVTILAIARRELPRQGFRFAGRTVLFPRGPAPPGPRLPPDTLTAVAGLLPGAAVLGTATLPPQGTVALATLKGGVPVWVVHHRSGGITVLAADHLLPLPGLRGLRAPVRWRPWARRLCSMLMTQRHHVDCFDAHGTSVVGLHRPPLDRHVFRVEPVDGGGKRVVIGRRVPGQRRITVAPRGHLRRSKKHVDHGLLKHAAARRLGPERALTQPDGSYVVVGAVLDVLATGQALLCTPKRARPVCPAGSPVVFGLKRLGTVSRPVKRLKGPFGVVIKAGRITHLTWFGHGPIKR